MNNVNKMIYLKVLLSIIAMGAFFTAVNAEVKLPAVFNHHMVLQQQKAVPIWGQARAGEAITVHFKEQTVKTVANDNGAWQVTLKPMAATYEGDTLVVTADNEIRLTDVVVGEVWLCSGQSNMHWQVAATGLYETEIAESKQYPLMRLFSVPELTIEPKVKRQSWEVVTPVTVKDFSAVGYFFGLALYKKLKVPIGLIHASVGNTQIEAWMNIDTLLKLKIPAITTRINSELAIKERFDQHKEMALQHELLKWKQAVQTAQAQGEKPPLRPETLWHPEQSPWMAGNLYQQMIKPLIPYAIRGVIWYQGESNAKNAKQYQKLFPALIRSWRQAWQADEFPFLYVQLANFLAVQTQPIEDASWPFLREAQLMTLSVANTAMVSAIDLGETNTIHPPRKKEVAERLAQAAFGLAYGVDIVYSGPLYEHMKIEANKIIITFKHSGSGLIAKGDKLNGFAIAGKDKQWLWAQAKIDTDNTVVVQSDKLEAPVAVRYSWANNPIGNLYNKEGLPAFPFRTDNWQQESKFWRFLRRNTPWFW